MATAEFERRGKLGRHPVFKCRGCGAVVIVKRRLLGGLTVASVDDETAATMNAAWIQHAVGTGMERSERRRQEQHDERRTEALAAGRVECPDCGKLLRSEPGLVAHIRAVHGDDA